MKQAARICLLLVGFCLLSGTEILAGDAFDRVKSTGLLRIATDDDYAPLSFARADGSFDGFDIAVAREIAERLGVGIDFVVPEWDVITAGRWRGRWDLSVGSMTATSQRAERLDLPAIYYYAPAIAAVRADDQSLGSVPELNGRTIGTCGGCTYAEHLRGHLANDPLLAPHIVHSLKPGRIVTYDTDRLAYEDLAAGALDAVLLGEPSVEGAIADGFAIRALEEPIFYEPLALAIEKSDPEFSAALVQIVEEMLADGTLSQLSEQWLGQDYTRKLTLSE